MAKIIMRTPLVEMDGDEMTRIVWKWIKDILIEPYVELKTEYYDLGLESREKTKDQITIDSAEATKKYGVAVKCATITPNAARVKEYNLTEMWKSPNGTIRAILDGTVFREPILVKGISPFVRTWKKPISIARHAYGDVYKNTEMKIEGQGKAELVFTDENGIETRKTIHDFTDPGINMGMHNTEKVLPVPALIMLWTKNRTCGLQPRILYQKPMTTALRTSSRIFSMLNIKKSLMKPVLSIFILL